MTPITYGVLIDGKRAICAKPPHPTREGGFPVWFHCDDCGWDTFRPEAGKCQWCGSENIRHTGTMAYIEEKSMERVMIYEGHKTLKGKVVHAIWRSRDGSIRSRWLCGKEHTTDVAVPADWSITCRTCMKEVNAIMKGAREAGLPDDFVQRL